MNCFCTIITRDYFHFALTLCESLNKFSVTPFYILVVDLESDGFFELKIPEHFENIKILKVSDVLTDCFYLKDRLIFSDVSRWSLKPKLLKKLLTDYKRVIFLDCDLFFVNDYSFLFDELVNSSILLSPHWRNYDPKDKGFFNSNDFSHNFTHGIFNAGFIGCSKYSTEFLDWWWECCLRDCKKSFSQGLYDDQKYLDLVPFIFENVKVINHKGCNVSEWNQVVCYRSVAYDGSLLIAGKFPVIFFHFYNLYKERAFDLGRDLLVLPFYNEWLSVLEKYKKFSLPKSNSEETSKQANARSLIKRVFVKIKLKKRILAFLRG